MRLHSGSNSLLSNRIADAANSDKAASYRIASILETGLRANPLVCGTALEGIKLLRGVWLTECPQRASLPRKARRISSGSASRHWPYPNSHKLARIKVRIGDHDQWLTRTRLRPRSAADAFTL
jgi:hypothetical protein